MASPDSQTKWNIFWAVIVPGALGVGGAVGGYLATQELQKPKLSGSLLFVSYGETTPGEITPYAQKGVTVYAVLENQREATVTPIRYLLEVQTPDGMWHEEKPFEVFYGKMPKGFRLLFDARTLRYAGNGTWEVVFPSDGSLLTSKLSQPVKKGESVGGVLPFVLPIGLRTTAVRVRVLDSNGTSHVLKKTDGDFDPNVLIRLDSTVQINELPPGRY